MTDLPEKEVPNQSDKPADIRKLRSPIGPEMQDTGAMPPKTGANSATDNAPLRSPIRPDHPEAGTAPPAPKAGLISKAAQLSAKKNAQESDVQNTPENPEAALQQIKYKMEVVANEFGDGKLNRAQFNAIYGRYSEQRTIIERLIERNPENPAWKQAAAPGHTSFLRQHFEARLTYYLVYQHNISKPLTMDGKQEPNFEQVGSVLQALWGMRNRPKVGLARKDMGNGQWLVMALGENAVTLAMFMLEPSVAQSTLVRDLHNDFERANRKALGNGTSSVDRFVFPQRALAENSAS
ncbi:MAG: hypothetical protein R3E39_14435 [Anaerolineae bacterium]